jgi:hypothetical protein
MSCDKGLAEGNVGNESQDRAQQPSAEMRRALGAKVPGVCDEELRLLEKGSAQAKLKIAEVNRILDAGAARAERFCAEGR